MKNWTRQLLAVLLLVACGSSVAFAQSSPPPNPNYTQYNTKADGDIPTPPAGKVRFFYNGTNFRFKTDAGAFTDVGAGLSGLTAGKLTVATSATAIANSKWTMTGGSLGTATLYDDGAAGVSTLAVRAGVNQGTVPSPLANLFANDGTTVLAQFTNKGYLGIGAAGNATDGLRITATTGMTAHLRIVGTGGIINPNVEFNDASGNVGSVSYATNAFGLSDASYGLAVQIYPIGGSNTRFGLRNGNDNLWTFLGTEQEGLFKVTTDGTTPAGFGYRTAATNTVSDALILRHATTATVGDVVAGFGTGLLFQGENAAGTMHDMASIDAVYTDATDGSEDTEVWLNTFAAGADGAALVFSRDAIRGSNLILNAADGSSGHVYLQTGNTTRWMVIGGGAGRLIPAADNTYDIGASTNQVKDSYLGTSIQGTRTKTLTDTVATDFVTIAIPNNTSVGGTIEYTITYTSGGNQEIETGVLAFAGQNEAGTEAASVSAVGTALQLPAGTMTNVFAVTTGTDNMTISCDADSTALTADPVISYRVYVNSGTATVTPIP